MPPKIAPIQIVIVPIFNEKNKKDVLKEAEKLKKKLKNYRVEIDDRDEYSPGWKFNEWEMKGVPIRIEIGPKDIKKKQFVAVRRDNGKKEFLKNTKKIQEIMDDIQDILYEKSKKNLLKSIVKVKTMDELKKAIDDKRFALAPFCGNPGCEDYIKEETGGADSRCIPFDQEKIKGKCIRCDKEAKFLVYFAKSY